MQSPGTRTVAAARVVCAPAMILAIAGMHRSGTSLVASWLQACGLVLQAGNSIPPYPDNPKGFFEDADFIRLHEMSIRRRARLSSGWKLAPARSLAFSAPEAQVAQTLIVTRQERYNCWGWKDPRTMLFLDQWKALVPQLRVLVVWRPCAQVVSSLLRRWWKSRTRQHCLDPLWAIRLWQAHNQLACDFAMRYPSDVVVLPIAQVIERDQSVLTYLNQRFDSALSYQPLHSLYEPGLFGLRPAPPALRGLCAVMNCYQLEQRLTSLSAKPSRSEWN
jgi:hypothetical protein